MGRVDSGGEFSIRELPGAPNDGIFPNASEVSEMCYSVLEKPV